HLLHRLLQLDLALDLPRPLLTSTAPRRGDDRHRGEARPRHACHSIPLPTAAPTTRATAWPPTTMPWLSSSCLSRRSRSSRLSDKVAGGLGRVVEVGEGCSSTERPPLTSPDLPSSTPPRLFSISAPIPSSIV